MLDKSYELVLHGFSKKKQQEILLTTYCGLECTDFPCQLLTEYSCDTEHGDNPPGARIATCKEVKGLQDKFFSIL
jgi:hypothetical protein